VATPRAQALLAIVLGALQSLAFGITALWLLPLLTLAWLRVQLDGCATPARAAGLGWCYGLGWLTAAVWWLFISLHRYGSLPAPLAALAVAALSATLALYLALACGLYRRWRPAASAGAVALFAALWLLAELARGLLFSGFPWAASGYSQVDSPLALAAPWLGVYGMGALLALSAAVLAGAWRQPAGRPAAAAVAAAWIAAALAGSGPEFSRSTGEVSVRLLQPAVAQDEKFASRHMPAALQWLAAQMTASPAALTVAPETAVPLLPHQLEDFAPGWWASLAAHFAVPGRAALLGLPLGDFERGYTNSVAGLQAAAPGQAPGAGLPYRYDKSHLVPFGEFVPPGFRWFTEALNIPLGDFDRGSLRPPPFVALGQRLAPHVCYEDLFGEELSRRFADPATAPTALVNVSNIGWFGDTVAVPQHLNISRLRALEFERPVLRATNTGATALIDHRARVSALLPPFTRGVLDGRFEGRDGLTPYARWTAAFGLWPLIVAALGIVAAAAMVSTSRRAPASPP